MNHKTLYYDWITDDIAIGELNSNYDGFDAIINLAYINPSFNRGLNHRSFRNFVNKNQEIYEFGLYDSEEDVEYIKEIIEFIIPILMSSKKILFHCQSGKSRSVTLALAYLCKKNNIDRDEEIDEYLSFIKNKRPIINPRSSFIKVARKYLKENKE
jgi:protein-tyrosine phosphatase